MKSLGEKIRYYRNIKGWSQADMAYKLDISLPAYSKIERNITDVNYSRLVQIAKLFGISVSELVALHTTIPDQNDLQKALTEKEKEIMQLQKKIIELLEREK